MKSSSKKLTRQITFIVIIATALYCVLSIFILTRPVINSFSDTTDQKLAMELESEVLKLKNSTLQVEQVVTSMSKSVESILDEAMTSSDLDSFESRTNIIFREYLTSENSISYSLYVYLDPTLDGDVHDVWLTNQSGLIKREDEIPKERYEDNLNMSWFTEVVNGNVSGWIPPYYNRYDQYITSYVQPIFLNNQAVGIIGMYFDIKNISSQLLPINTEHSYYWLLNPSDKIIYHPSYKEGMSLEATHYNFEKSVDNYYLDESDNRTLRHYTVFVNNGWKFIHTINEKVINQSQNNLIFLAFLLVGFGLVLLWFLLFIYTRKINKTITNIQSTLHAAAQGDYDKRIDLGKKYDTTSLPFAVNNLMDSIEIKTKKIEDVAYYANITGLPNKNRLIQDLIAHKNDSSIILYLIDLDNFTEINRLISRKRGDKLISAICEQLIELQDDRIKLYNITSDEFALIEYTNDYNNIGDRAKEILAIFEQFTYRSNYSFTISCSIGVSKFPDDASNVEEFIRNAEFALKEAKMSGKDTYKIFSRFISDDTQNNLELQEDLEQGIRDKEFILHYQPRYNNEMDIIGLEALVRWNHPRKGLLFPSYFLTYAEQSGLINPLGEVILEKICNDIKKMQAHNFYPPTISVNLSARQLLSPLLISSTLGVLRQESIDPGMIEIDITDGIFLYDRDKSLKKINALKVAGMKIALDDFGSKEISLINIKDIPLSTIKLNKEIVEIISSSQEAYHFVNSLIKFSHDLQLTVTAVGIENDSELKILKELKCDAFQGYLFSEPKSVDELLKKVINPQ
jgi:diguanylate cyclase (GGDEF)-like protein